MTRRAARGFTLRTPRDARRHGRVGAAVTAVGQRMGQESKADAGRVTDLSALRRAARLLEDDLRAGRDPVAEGWFLIGDRLRRRDVVVARSVAAFDVRREGDLWHVGLTLARDEPKARDARPCSTSPSACARAEDVR